MDCLDMLTIDDLDCSNKELAELIGFENFKKLVKNYGGGYLYICKKETFVKEIRNRKIMRYFEQGKDYIKLSK